MDTSSHSESEHSFGKRNINEEDDENLEISGNYS